MKSFSLTRRQIVTLGVLLTVIVIAGVLTYERLSPHGIFADLQNDLKKLQPTESPIYTDLNGNSVDLSEYKGTPLIINSWATWMPFSKDELTLLAKAKTTYGDAVQIIAINRMEQAPVVSSYKSTFGLPDSIVFLMDPIDHFYKTVGGYAMPETIFYRADGTIAAHARGVLTEVELDGFVQAIIAH